MSTPSTIPAAAAAIPSAVPSVAALVPAGLPLAQLAPHGEAPEVRAAVERNIARAVERALAVFAVPAGVAPGAPASSPVWAVPSASVAGRAHLVWIGDDGRLCCSCPARRNPRVLSCSHAAAVRLVLLAAAGRLVGASVPASSSVAPAVAPAPEPIKPEPEPDPTPPPAAPAALPVPALPAAASAGPPCCPCCGLPADPREIEELGECLACLAVRSGVQLARCACGAVASGEGIDGPICEQCQQERRERYTLTRMAEEEQSERNRARATVTHAKWNHHEERERARRATDPANRAGAGAGTGTAADLGTVHGFTYRRHSSGDVSKAPTDQPGKSRFYCTWASWMETGHGAARASIDDQGHIISAGNPDPAEAIPA